MGAVLLPFLIGVDHAVLPGAAINASTVQGSLGIGNAGAVVEEYGTAAVAAAIANAAAADDDLDARVRTQVFPADGTAVFGTAGADGAAAHNEFGTAAAARAGPEPHGTAHGPTAVVRAGIFASQDAARQNFAAVHGKHGVKEGHRPAHGFAADNVVLKHHAAVDGQCRSHLTYHNGLGGRTALQGKLSCQSETAGGHMKHSPASLGKRHRAAGHGGNGDICRNFQGLGDMHIRHQKDSVTVGGNFQSIVQILVAGGVGYPSGCPDMEREHQSQHRKQTKKIAAVLHHLSPLVFWSLYHIPEKTTRGKTEIDNFSFRVYNIQNDF